MALTFFVERSKVSFVVRVRGGDGVGCCVAAAGFRACVYAISTTIWVGIYGILSWIVASIVGAVGTVEGVEEVVE